MHCNFLKVAVHLEMQRAEKVWADCAKAYIALTLFHVNVLSGGLQLHFSGAELCLATAHEDPNRKEMQEP